MKTKLLEALKYYWLEYRGIILTLTSGFIAFIGFRDLVGSIGLDCDNDFMFFGSLVGAGAIAYFVAEGYSAKTYGLHRDRLLYYLDQDFRLGECLDRLMNKNCVDERLSLDAIRELSKLRRSYRPELEDIVYWSKIPKKYL